MITYMTIPLTITMKQTKNTQKKNSRTETIKSLQALSFLLTETNILKENYISIKRLSSIVKEHKVVLNYEGTQCCVDTNEYLTICYYYTHKIHLGSVKRYVILNNSLRKANPSSSSWETGNGTE